jgi:hypothetical protein
MLKTMTPKAQYKLIKSGIQAIQQKMPKKHMAIMQLMRTAQSVLKSIGTKMA